MLTWKREKNIGPEILQLENWLFLVLDSPSDHIKPDHYVTWLGLQDLKSNLGAIRPVR